MGAFPEDYEIRVSKLVKLWMAEGFMKASVSKSFEEGAEEYLDDLVKRSLVLVTRTKSTGKIKSCCVHDLVRDLCITKAREEKFLLYATDRDVKRVLPKPIKDQHRLSFRLLRVLDALTVTFMKFPVDVLELFHLSQQDMATIGSLPNLHVLKLRRCSFGDCKWETTEGEFAQLKFLKIERTNLKQWVTEESSHFPSLERLLLDCEELSEIPDVIGENPTLELIEVTETRWNKSLVDSAKCIKEKQKDYGNDNLQVQIREYRRNA
ncbi:putative late blight resistance proteinR1A-10 [Sesamum angolense]|uniref:Late blight resistance proteinR1A-10 n=1 Tax=Sesamum angolense TaxID=2727404 RepID=A0AAE1W312_9LAMI|nr:putative late blight resistance proteinR1A-10 [Sesamum angolense]